MTKSEQNQLEEAKKKHSKESDFKCKNKLKTKHFWLDCDRNGSEESRQNETLLVYPIYNNFKY